MFRPTTYRVPPSKGNLPAQPPIPPPDDISRCTLYIDVQFPHKKNPELSLSGAEEVPPWSPGTSMANGIRCVFPELTEERRKEYIKVAKTKAEEGRVSVRNIRRNAKQALEKLEKDGEVGKDDVTGAEKKLDATTKKHTDAIDEMLKAKEAELLEV